MSEWLLPLRYLLLAGVFLFLYRVVRAVGEDLRASAADVLEVPWAILTVEEGPGLAPGEVFPVRDTTVVGASPRSDVVLRDDAASPQHLRLVARSGGFWVEDLGSEAGTYLNGERLEAPAPVRHGDRLRVGSTVLRFLEPRGPEVRGGV